MTERRNRTVTSGVAEPPRRTHGCRPRIIGVGKSKFGCNKNWFSRLDAEFGCRFSEPTVLPFVIFDNPFKAVVRVELPAAHFPGLIRLNS
jgi:hypothetical protein